MKNKRFTLDQSTSDRSDRARSAGRKIPLLLLCVLSAFLLTACGENDAPSAEGTLPHESHEVSADAPVVYFTSDISPAGLDAVYEAMGVFPDADEKVGVKLHTGASEDTYYLREELIGDFVRSLDGTIVECNTALGGRRSNTAYHYQMAADHGFTAIAPVVILDEYGKKYC